MASWQSPFHFWLGYYVNHVEMHFLGPVSDLCWIFLPYFLNTWHSGTVHLLYIFCAVWFIGQCSSGQVQWLNIYSSVAQDPFTVQFIFCACYFSRHFTGAMWHWKRTSNVLRKIQLHFSACLCSGIFCVFILKTEQTTVTLVVITGENKRKNNFANTVQQIKGAVTGEEKR